MLQRTRSRKTLYTSSRTVFQLTPNITSRTNFQSPSCVFSSLFSVTRPRRCVSSSICIYETTIQTNTRDVVSGDHTRTIQIATPTVGGLMKFAVKTVTCLGCKTALRPNNSVKGTSLRVQCALRFSLVVLKAVLSATTVGPGWASCIKNK